MTIIMLCSEHTHPMHAQWNSFFFSDMTTTLSSSSSSYSSTAIGTLITVSLELSISILFLSRKSSATAPASNGAPRFPAVIVFGDSIVDPGNNNNLKTLVKCNFPPYGRDFMGGRPTGRFSNGRIPSDILGIEVYSSTYIKGRDSD